MPNVTMPKLSDTMEGGRILRWLKQAGDRIAVGDVLVEVETDKADMEVESALAGVLVEHRVAEGESVPVGAVIALVESAGGAAADAIAPLGAAGGAPDIVESVAGATGDAAAREGQGDIHAPPPAHPLAAAATPAVGGLAPGGGDAEFPPPLLPPRVPPSGRASPLARSRAADLGLDPTEVQGSGPGGRVLQRDVEAAAAARGQGTSVPAAVARGQGTPVPAPAVRTPTTPITAAAATRTEIAAAQSPAAGERGRVGVVRVARDAPAGAPADAPEVSPPSRIERVPLSPMRSSIARRMTLSKREVPHFYVEASARLDELLRLRESLRRQGGSVAGVTLNHLILCATAAALREQPALNSRFAGDAVEIVHEVNLGLVTAVPDGLVVPVLRRADELDLFALAARARDLTQRARDRRLRSEELSGGTFSVSNLGMYGVERFAAVINPPQAAILAVGAVSEKPVVRDGRVIVAPCVVLTLSCDHRAVDGAQAGLLLSALRTRLEDPVSLLLAVRRDGDDEEGGSGG